MRNNIDKIVYISSTSIRHRTSVYGNSKVICEEMVKAYVARHNMKILILRPRAFIPWYNQYAYKTFLD